MRATAFHIMLLLLPLTVAAAPQSGSDDALRGYFESVTTLSGRFEQTTRDERGDVVETSKGYFSLKRPDRFHWFYETPFEQRIVADGEWLYVHDVALSQVTIRPLEAVLGVGAAVVLSGDYEDLTASFRVRSQANGWYRLIPRNDDWDFQSVRLRLSDGAPAVVTVNDGLGQTTRLTLEQLERNTAIPDGRFRFRIPEDADVIAPDGFEGGSD